MLFIAEYRIRYCTNTLSINGKNKCKLNELPLEKRNRDELATIGITNCAYKILTTGKRPTKYT